MADGICAARLSSECDRLSALTITDEASATYDAAVDRLTLMGGGTRTAAAQLRHLRTRLFPNMTGLDIEAARDLALLDAALANTET